jgi:undecaprenyl diphosphate synthase
MSFLSDLDLTRIPRHVGIVMDGNGRWAKQRGLPRTEGHKMGEEALFDTVEGALEVGLQWLTVYGFSTENWRRPRDEVRFLMNFNRSLLRRRRDELHDRGVRILFTGRRDWRVPRGVLKEMEEAEDLTRANARMTLNIAFNYGGRTEIVDAVRRLLVDHDAGRLRGERLSVDSIAARLYRPDMPDPDLVIRTSGEQRLSGFLLWQSAHSEFYFHDANWPDFRRVDFLRALRSYAARQRRFGA